MATKEVRVLPADVYDALELSALVHGGVGQGSFTNGNGGTPLCVHGLAMGCTADCREEEEIRDQLDGVGIYFSVNDDAVTELLGVDRESLTTQRVTWQAWCAKLNVVRGDL